MAQMFFLEQSDLLFEFSSCKVLENGEQEKNRSCFDREKKRRSWINTGLVDEKEFNQEVEEFEEFDVASCLLQK